jgi:hypothetical protein
MLFGFPMQHRPHGAPSGRARAAISSKLAVGRTAPLAKGAPPVQLTTISPVFSVRPSARTAGVTAALVTHASGPCPAALPHSRKAAIAPHMNFDRAPMQDSPKKRLRDRSACPDSGRWVFERTVGSRGFEYLSAVKSGFATLRLGGAKAHNIELSSKWL